MISHLRLGRSVLRAGYGAGMQIVLTTRLGGPGIDRWPIVRLRRELKVAFEPWAVDALDTIDLALTVGGSVTSAEGHAGVHDAGFCVA